MQFRVRGSDEHIKHMEGAVTIFNFLFDKSAYYPFPFQMCHAFYKQMINVLIFRKIFQTWINDYNFFFFGYSCVLSYLTG